MQQLPHTHTHTQEEFGSSGYQHKLNTQFEINNSNVILPCSANKIYANMFQCIVILFFILKSHMKRYSGHIELYTGMGIVSFWSWFLGNVVHNTGLCDRRKGTSLHVKNVDI